MPKITLYGTEKILDLKAELRRRRFGHERARVLGLSAYSSETWEQDGFAMRAEIVPDNELAPRLEDDEALGSFAGYPDGKPGEYVKIDPRGSEKFDLERAGIGPAAYRYGEYECYWSNGSTGTVAETRAAYSRRGASKGVAEEMARANQRLFFELALRTVSGDIAFVGTVVTASRAGVELGSASVWGTEDDADSSHFDELASECALDALGEANGRIDDLIRAAARIAA